MGGEMNKNELVTTMLVVLMVTMMTGMLNQDSQCLADIRLMIIIMTTRATFSIGTATVRKNRIALDKIFERR